jgi:hypothetical protein
MCYICVTSLPRVPHSILHSCHVSTPCPSCCVTFVSCLYPLALMLCYICVTSLPVSLALCYIWVTSLPRVPHSVLHMGHVSTQCPLLCVKFVSRLCPVSLTLCYICVTSLPVSLALCYIWVTSLPRVPHSVSILCRAVMRIGGLTS